MYKHVLIATDGSALADKAVAHGLALAKAVGARVTIATVTEMWSPREMASRVTLGESFPTEDFERRMSAEARAILDPAAASAKVLGVPCEALHVPDQTPADGILKAAAERGCDLIVLSSHGRSGISRLVLGSQASDVVAGARAPVLVCK